MAPRKEKTKEEIDKNIKDVETALTFNLRDLEGIGKVRAERLQSIGIKTAEDLIVRGANELATELGQGFDVEKANEMIESARKFLLKNDVVGKAIMTGREFLNWRTKKIQYLKTGAENLDEALGEGFESGVITELYGKDGCIPLDEYIYTPNGITKVKNIYNGMPILGGYIKDPYIFEDDVYELSIGYTTFRASSEHPIWMKKGTDYKKFTHKPRWMTIKDIYNHYQNKKSNNTRWFGFCCDQAQFDFNVISIGKKFSKLLGYLMSDGYFSEKQSVKFTNTNRSFIEEVIELSTDYNLNIKSYDKGNGMDLMLVGKHGNSSSMLKDKLREIGVINRTTFGKIMNLQKDELIEFIKGFFNGDGTLILDQHSVKIIFYTGIHRDLAYEFQFMLWRLGIKSMVTYRKRKENYKGDWTVTVTKRKQVEKLLPIMDHSKYPEKFKRAIEIVKNMSNSMDSQEDNEGEWIPIRSIKYIGKQKVCGWETKPSNEIISYNGLKTHNSGKTQICMLASILAQLPYKRKCFRCKKVFDDHTTERCDTCKDKNGQPIKTIKTGGLSEPSKPCRVLYIDTENSFRPERVMEIVIERGLVETREQTKSEEKDGAPKEAVDPEDAIKFIDNIDRIRPTDSAHQKIIGENLGDLIKGENYCRHCGVRNTEHAEAQAVAPPEKKHEFERKDPAKLLVIDSLTSAFRLDYVGRGEISGRQDELKEHIKHISRLAEVHNIVTLITNQVLLSPGASMFEDPTKPIGGMSLAHTSTHRIYLRPSGKKGKVTAILVDSPNNAKTEGVIKLSKVGIENEEK